MMDKSESAGLIGADLALKDADSTTENGTILPWFSSNPSTSERQAVSSNSEVTPGEYVLRTLFHDFTILAERKIELAVSESEDKPLSKTLQKGEDPQFDQLLSSLNVVAEYSLSSLLRTLFQWYEKQLNNGVAEGDECDLVFKHKGTQLQRPKSGTAPESPRPPPKISKERDHNDDKRELAVNFIFCLVLIEVLKQLTVHPCDEKQTQYIENLAFCYFKKRWQSSDNNHTSNSHIVAALYAEVVGVLSQTQFSSLKRRFLLEFRESQINSSALINLVYGMKYLKIKLFPVEELEEGFMFLQECAGIFLDARDKEVKYAFAAIFVDILLPVAATAKREFNVPALKNFVDFLYLNAFEMARKAKHSLSLYPLVTVLLCVSQKQFFLANWHLFLSMCLSTLKHRDSKMQRVSMECLYRLLWVYMIRLKGESNASTMSRLRSVTDTLFPRGSRTVIPRDAPLGVFVKIIHFLAMEKLDFAMQDIIFDLLGVGRTTKQLFPERMNIGLRAFLVIADNLQRKEGDPPMPSTNTALPSGHTIRVKKTYLTKTLTTEVARSIGMANYYNSIRKALENMLRWLDSQVGRTMVMTNPQCLHKEADDMITGERKPKIDLFRTCIYAIPRLIPEGMAKSELVELLSRLTVHMDEELRGLAFQSLQNLITTEVAEWREEVIMGYVNFILRDIQDSLPSLLDSTLRILLQLLTSWKAALTSTDTASKKTTTEVIELSSHSLHCEVSYVNALHSVEGSALVLLCSIRQMPRKLAMYILKEVRQLSTALEMDMELEEKLVIDIIEEISPEVIESHIKKLSISEKNALGPIPAIADLHWLVERLPGNTDKETGETGNLELHGDLWCNVLASLLAKNKLPFHCSSAIHTAWPIVYNRLWNLYTTAIEPVTSGMDSLSTLSSVYSRGPKKAVNMNDLCLWRNYLVFACAAYTNCSQSSPEVASQEGGSSTDGSISESRSESRSSSPHFDNPFRFVVPLLRMDITADIKETIIIGLGKTNPASYREFLDEVQLLMRDASDRRQESLRKRRKRDVLRNQLAKIFRNNAENGCFSDNESGLIEKDGLSPVFMEYIEGTKLYLESENDKDMPAMNAMQQLRYHFCGFIYQMLESIPDSCKGNILSSDLRYALFVLFSSWCGDYSVKTSERQSLYPHAVSEELQEISLHAMCSLLCCGPVFDPSALAPDGYVYPWLQLLLDSRQQKLHSLGQLTLQQLLENNGSTPSLLNWVIDTCFTSTKRVATGCFKALSSVFTTRSYPGEKIPLLNLVLFKAADASLDIREKAVQLLQLLERRFFPYSAGSVSSSPHSGYAHSHVALSKALSQAHPELTMYMLSEMTSRFESASTPGQRHILQYMLPWLCNVELLDISNMSSMAPPTPTPPVEDADLDEADDNLLQPVILEGEGWGSVKATQMVLNNLFYITVKFDDDFNKELEACWASLANAWSNNIHEILSYVITLAGIGGNPDILPHAKKLAVYLARANTEKTVDELMEELKTTEPVTSMFERCDKAPYYRPLNKPSTSFMSVNAETNMDEQPVQNKNKTCKQVADDSGSDITIIDDEPKKKPVLKEKQDSTENRGSTSSSESSVESSDDVPLPPELCPPTADTSEVDEELVADGDWTLVWALEATELSRRGLSHALPVPEEPYYAPLVNVIPFAPASTPLYRCNFSLIVITELVLDQAQVDWSIHLPLMLHVIFLGLDHGKALVYEHCKRLLVNLVVVLGCHGNQVNIAQPLLHFQTVSETGLGKFHRSFSGLGEFPHMTGHCQSNISAGTDSETDSVNSMSTVMSDLTGAGTSDGSASLTAGSGLAHLMTDEDKNYETENVEEKAKHLICFLAGSECKPLWAFEDITARNHSIHSAEQMEIFLNQTLGVFISACPKAQVQEEWAKVALQWATSCSSRHYAGRSFQIFRALHVPLSWGMLSDVLSRLVESVGDSNEDVQGYVLEILLTLESALDWTVEVIEPHDETDKRRHTVMMDDPVHEDTETRTHFTLATSYSTPLGTDLNKFPMFPRPKIDKSTRHLRSLSSDFNIKNYNRNFAFGLTWGMDNESSIRARSTSMMSLRHVGDQHAAQTQVDLVTRIFWIAVSLLESDYEHEFLMAIQLLTKVISVMELSKSECLDKLERVLHKLKWTAYPGLQALLLKGLTSSGTCDSTLQLLSKLTHYCHVSLVDPSQSTGFALNTLAVLPYLITHFDNPDEFCISCAKTVSDLCSQSSLSLSNLGKMFSLYSQKAYTKSVQMWVDVVCRYFHDVYGNVSKTTLTFLLEVLERGPSTNHQPILMIICGLMKHVDFTSSSMRQFHNELLKVISQHIKGNMWQESLNILKLAVSNSSQIEAPPPRPVSSMIAIYDSSWSLDTVSVKKELPGRTLDFTFDFSLNPTTATPKNTLEVPRGDKDIHSLPSSTGESTGWKKPQASQRRTRERLVSVLTTCGHNVGLKQSPSVVFSSSSDLAVEKQTSQYSSSEEASLADGLETKDESGLGAQQIMGVLNNFDFLDDELDCREEDLGGFGWGAELGRRDSFEASGESGEKVTQLGGSLSGSEPDLTSIQDFSDEDDELNRSFSESTSSTSRTRTNSHCMSAEIANILAVPGDADEKDKFAHKRQLSSCQGSETSSESHGDSPASGSPQHKPNTTVLSATEFFSPSEDIEQQWSTHVSAVVSDTSGTVAVNTFSLFYNLFKTCQRRVYNLTRECCNHLDDKFQDVTAQFSSMVDHLVRHGDCPHIYVNTETLRNTRLLEKMKFIVLEIHDHYLNFTEKKEKTVQCLEDLKMSMKQLSFESNSEDMPIVQVIVEDSEDKRYIDLCWRLYKLHFQLLLVLGSYARLVDLLCEACHKTEVLDFSQDISERKSEITAAIDCLAAQDVSLPEIEDTSTLSKTPAMQSLVEYLNQRQPEQAVRLLRALRLHLEGNLFGNSDLDDLDVLLGCYGRHLAVQTSAVFVMSRPEYALSEVCNELMEMNVQVLSSLEHFKT